MMIHKKTNEKLMFSAEVDDSLANAIRRSVQEIPVLAIDELEISQNDSVLYDEIVAHRIGLIPLKNEKGSAKKSKKGDDEVEFKLKLSKKGPATVYSGDLSGAAEVVFKEMPITVLRKGQEIELVATAKFGMGITHVKHSPGLVHYREFYEATPKKGKTVSKEFLNEFSTQMISLDNDGAELEFERQKLENGWTMGQAFKNYREDITTTKGNGLMFFVESYGQMKPEEIIIEAVEALKKNLNELESEN